MSMKIQDLKTHLDWALYYRGLGWSIIPVGTNKVPLTAWEEFQTRLPTKDEVHTSWTQFPDANIGVVTGKVSGIIVIDIEKGGSTSDYPPTVTSKTGGGGWHLIYKSPGVPIKNSVKLLAPLTDVRGDGGYVVLPPSLHASGNEYEWVISPEESDCAELPQDLLEKLKESKKKTDWKEFPTTVVLEGERNNEAARYAGKLLHDLSRELWETAGWDSLRAWNRSAARPPLDERELRTTFQSIAKRQTQSRKEWQKDSKTKTVSSKAMTLRMSDVQPIPISWLWPGRIALGKLTLIAGDPGLGKSLVSISLAANVSKAGMWPLEGSQAPLGSVVLLSAEDDPGDTIRPRLDAAEADCSRIHIIQAIRDVDAEGKPTQRMFSFRKDIAVLEELLPTLPDCRLLIIDPVSAYLDGTKSHENAEVRGVLAPLAKLASDFGVAVVVVQHLNKNSGDNAMYRSMGSIGFVAAARAAYIVTKDKDNQDRRLVMPVKNNLAKDTTGLAYSIVESGNGAPMLVWESEPVLITADEALGRSDTNEEKTKIEWAKQVLLSVLANGPVTAAEINREAKQAGISVSTLNRAKDRLGIKPKKTDFKGGWVWSLPANEDIQTSEDTASGVVDILGRDEHLGSAEEAETPIAPTEDVVNAITEV